MSLSGAYENPIHALHILFKTMKNNSCNAQNTCNAQNEAYVCQPHFVPLIIYFYVNMLLYLSLLFYRQSEIMKYKFFNLILYKLILTCRLFVFPNIFRMNLFISIKKLTVTLQFDSTESTDK